MTQKRNALFFHTVQSKNFLFSDFTLDAWYREGSGRYKRAATKIRKATQLSILSITLQPKVDKRK